MWTALIAIALLIGLLIFAAQLQLSLRITRAKTDVPVFNQIFVLCLVSSGRIDHFAICMDELPSSPLLISGIATAISLPLTVWIMSLEEQDQEDQQLRQKLCSVVVVVNCLSHKQHCQNPHYQSCISCPTFNNKVRTSVQQLCVVSPFMAAIFRFFLVLHADGLIRW